MKLVRYAVVIVEQAQVDGRHPVHVSTVMLHTSFESHTHACSNMSHVSAWCRRVTDRDMADAIATKKLLLYPDTLMFALRTTLYVVQVFCTCSGHYVNGEDGTTYLILVRLPRTSV